MKKPVSIKESVAATEDTAKEQMLTDEVIEKRRKKFWRDALAIHAAASLNAVAVVKKMLDADITQLHAHDRFKSSPLHYAAEANALETVQLLLSKEADINYKKGEWRRAPIHEALLANATTVAELLIEKGAILSSTCASIRDTPLHIAAMRDNAKIAKLLIAKDIDCNMQNDNGNMPLHITAYYNAINVAKLLFHKADHTVKNWDEYTPLDVAKEQIIYHKNDTRMIDLLSAAIMQKK